MHSIGDDGRCSCSDPGGALCTPGKHPSTEHGFKDASSDEATVRAWWTKTPHANIGLALGRATGMWALDIDVRIDRETGEVLTDGEATLTAMCAEHGELPSTLTARSGGGGRHLFFSFDESLPVGCPKLGLVGLDIKGEGGYVVLPPSNHSSGRPYEWIFGPEAAEAVPPPAWLLKRVLAGAERAAKRAAAAPASPAVALSTPTSIDPELAAALAVIPPNVGYETWLAVAMGLHDETGGSDEGFALFHEWSARARGLTTPTGNPAYTGEDSCRRKWGSFTLSTGNMRGRRTVFDIAIHEYGFQPIAREISPAFVGIHAPGNGAAPRMLSMPPTAEPEWVWDRRLPPQFPLDEAFPPALRWLRDFMTKIAHTYQVPIDLPVLLAAPIAMSALAGKFKIKVPGERWSEPAVLWTLCAMTSGGGKSPVHRDLIHPVREWEAKLDNSRAVAEQKSRIMIAEVGVKQAMQTLHKRAATIDPGQRAAAEQKLIDANEKLEFAKAQAVQSDALIAAEATTERLVELLQRSHGRVLVSDAEGDIFDVAMGRYSNSTPNLGPWLKGYDGDTIKQERVGGDRIVHNPLISVGVATQPEALQFLTDKVAQGRGFVARFATALIYPERGRLFMPGRDMEESEFATWNRCISTLLAMPRPKEPDELTLSPEARRLFQEWGQSLFSKMDAIEAEEGEDPRDAWFRKYPGKVLRVALLLHGLQDDCLRRLVVDVETMAAAIAWGRYLAEHNDAMAVELRTDPELRIVERVLTWLERNDMAGQVVTVRQLLRGLQGPRSGVRHARDLAGPLATLVETNWLAGIGRPSQGRPGAPGHHRSYQVVTSLGGHLARHRADELARARLKAQGDDARPKRW